MVHKKTPAKPSVDTLTRHFKEYLRVELMCMLYEIALDGYPDPALDVYGNTLDNMDERQLANIVAIYRRRQIQRDRAACIRKRIDDWFACRREDIARCSMWLKTWRLRK